MAKTKKELRAIAVGRAIETGKCFEQLLQEESPARFKSFCERMRKATIARIEAAKPLKRYVRGKEMDAVYRSLSNAIAEQIAADERSEKFWSELRARTVSARPWVRD